MYKIKVNQKEEFVCEPSADGKSGSLNAKPFVLDIHEIKAGTFHVLRDNTSYRIEVVKMDETKKNITLKINGHKYDMLVKDKYEELLTQLGIASGSKTVKELKAPMPGMVLDIMIEDGMQIAKDQPLLVLEAMKMENVLKAPSDVVVKSVNVKKGNAVEKNQVLISFE